MDTLHLFDALEGVSRACCSFARRDPLVARVHHVVSEVEDHIVAEAKVLAGWTGFGA